MVTYELFGPLDSVLGRVLVEEVVILPNSLVVQDVVLVELVLLGLVVANMVTRKLAYDRYAEFVADADDSFTRWPVHEATNVLLIVVAFYYLSLYDHAGLVASALALGLFITDFFEFEARKVEARREIEFEPPKAAISASFLLLLYVGYVTFLYGPLAQLIAP